MISPEALTEFKAIWLDEHGEDLPDDIALDEAINLLTMFNKIYRSVKKDWIINDEFRE